MRVLIAEDEPIARRLIVKYVTDYLEADAVANGLEAVALFEEALAQDRRYELVFLDIMMPGLDGQQALARIRDLESARGIKPSEAAPVVMTTALDDEENIFDAHVAGCIAYLVKPFRRADVLQVLESLGFAPRGGQV